MKNLFLIFGIVAVFGATNCHAARNPGETTMHCECPDAECRLDVMLIGTSYAQSGGQVVFSCKKTVDGKTVFCKDPVCEGQGVSASSTSVSSQSLPGHKQQSKSVSSRAAVVRTQVVRPAVYEKIVIDEPVEIIEYEEFED